MCTENLIFSKGLVDSLTIAIHELYGMSFLTSTLTTQSIGKYLSVVHSHFSNIWDCQVADIQLNKVLFCQQSRQHGHFLVCVLATYAHGKMPPTLGMMPFTPGDVQLSTDPPPSRGRRPANPTACQREAALLQPCGLPCLIWAALGLPQEQISLLLHCLWFSYFHWGHLPGEVWRHQELRFWVSLR